MITTVCLNPSFDKTANVAAIKAGEVNRLNDLRIDMGGKGLNVAVVAHRLGLEAQCLGIMGNQGSELMSRLIEKEGVHAHFVKIDGSVRTNLKVVSIKDGHVTEFNEPGEAVSDADFQTFRNMVKKECVGSEYLVLTGSLPPGCNEDAYKVLMQDTKGVPCILDTLGDKLTCALEAQPFIIKPNLSELESTLRQKLNTLRSIRDAAVQLIDKGAQNVVVSMGHAGALLTDGTRTFYAPALKVKAKSTVGAGDAMVGGMLLGLKVGGITEAFKYGIAAGAASVMTEGTQLIRPEDFEELLPQVKLQGV